MSLLEKEEMMSHLYKVFQKEFKVKTVTKRQIDMKYRKYRIQIVDFLDNKNAFSEYYSYFTMIDENSNTFLSDNRQDIKTLNKYERKKLVISFIHMHINRIIRANQRMHELVFYGLLADYYKMKLALIKYNP